LITWTAPQEFNTAQKKNLVVRAVDYQLIAGHLYKMGADIILRICVLEHERPRILVEAHEGIQEDIMQEKISHRRYCTHDYGGRLFTEIQRTIAIDVMCVRGLVNLIDGMRFP
jgi:hypothetical protein